MEQTFKDFLLLYNLCRPIVCNKYNDEFLKKFGISITDICTSMRFKYVHLLNIQNLLTTRSTFVEKISYKLAAQIKYLTAFLATPASLSTFL